MIKDKVPQNTLVQIQQHLIRNSRISEKRWHSVKDEEDSCTGDFCGQLSSDWTKFHPDDEQAGRWRIKYRKFGSKRNALEPLIGADGIIQIAIFNSFNEPIFRKGLLFQAKKEPIKKKKELLGQITNMNEFTPEKGNSVFVFGENGYYGMSSKTYSKNPISRDFEKKDFIGNFLANEFMECNVGLEGLYFSVTKNVLYIPRRVPLPVHLQHNMIIEIENS
ncbi:MAG TPA: hypothetical protein PLL53_05015 [Saprospiraceae bacterium]|nr:hypothetical protein [Saprospiraceae bacterium]